MAKFVYKDLEIDSSLFFNQLDSSHNYTVLSTDSAGRVLLKDLELTLLKDVSISENIVNESNLVYDNSMGYWKNIPPVDIPALVSGLLSNSQYNVILPPGNPSTTINHNLGTLYPRVSAIDSSGNYLINTGVTYIDSSSLILGISLPLDSSVMVIVNGDPQNVSTEYQIGGGTNWEVQGTEIDGGSSW